MDGMRLALRADDDEPAARRTGDAALVDDLDDVLREPERVTAIAIRARVNGDRELLAAHDERRELHEPREFVLRRHAFVLRRHARRRREVLGRRGSAREGNGENGERKRQPAKCETKPVWCHRTSPQHTRQEDRVART